MSNLCICQNNFNELKKLFCRYCIRLFSFRVIRSSHKYNEKHVPIGASFHLLETHKYIASFYLEQTVDRRKYRFGWSFCNVWLPLPRNHSICIAPFGAAKYKAVYSPPPSDRNVRKVRLKFSPDPGPSRWTRWRWIRRCLHTGCWNETVKQREQNVMTGDGTSSHLPINCISLMTIS